MKRSFVSPFDGAHGSVEKMPPDAKSPRSKWEFKYILIFSLATKGELRKSDSILSMENFSYKCWKVGWRYFALI